MLEDYKNALKSGQRAYRACVARGQSPYLAVLDDILVNVNIVAQVSDNVSRLNGRFYYVHQSSRFQYPIQTAREYQDFNVDKHRRSYAPFERMQDYFVLLRNEDGVWRIRQ